MTTKFNVTWPDGHTSEEVSETATPEAYAMERWGCNTLEELASLGIAIALPSNEGLTSFSGIATPAPTPAPGAQGETKPESPTPTPTPTPTPEPTPAPT